MSVPMQMSLIFLFGFIGFSVVIFLTNFNDPVRRRKAIWPLLFGIILFVVSYLLLNRQ